MLDLDRLGRISLSARPVGQRVVAWLLLLPNYSMPPGVKITFEGQENLPDEPVVFAMNHTDRYNYWPFMLQHWRQNDRFIATWVKGKYYENPTVGYFMELTNNIPTVSRGYIITKDFLSALGRRPTDDEYRAARDWVNAVARGEALEAPAELPRALLEGARDILGRRFQPPRESYAQAIDGVFRAMMRRFVELNEEAAALGLDLLIFPQGTRSRRLLRGRPGLSQIAMHLDRAVVPVGCSGSDRLYPSSSPVAKPGHVVYRFGEPLRRADAAAWVERGRFEPFTAEAERDFADEFQAYVDDVMARIEPLVDPEYRFAADSEADVQGSDRFV
ncbi:MAG: 1-acyl-sn-glycerol-3-phosphate acyltransferase [Sandaracinaceae bacterium]|nr:1-acyl-sn-glycerol-3-phosphate acyltransferase [Sandaracinaceae bacterium]